MAAIMVLFNHTKADISCLDHNQCLLALPTKFFVKVYGPDVLKCGCYLYFDLNNGEWIRSGKAISSNFGGRHDEHKKEARLKTASSEKSKFYNSYPSQEAPIHDSRAQRSSFENLQQFVAIGYDKLFIRKLLLDVYEGGIFHLDRETNNKNNNINFKGNKRLQEKQLNMLGYLWELTYDLCIAPASDISGNSGFEVLLGVN